MGFPGMHLQNKDASMPNPLQGLDLLVHKEPIVATHIGEFSADAAVFTYNRYANERLTFVTTPEIQEYQDALIQTVLDHRTAIGCLVAPFGYGKTSTAISIWQTCEEANLLGIPPFSCSSIAEMGQAIASAVVYRLEENGMSEAAAAISSAYDNYLVSSAHRLAQQDVEKYGIEYDVALRSIREKIESGHIQLEASGTHLLRFLEEVVGVVVDAGFNGLIVLVDEFQQFLGNINKAIITNFRSLIWGLRTRGNLPLGFVLTLDPDTEQNLLDRGADILHRIRKDGLYLAFAHVYDREFPRRLWGQYAEAFGFGENSNQIVDFPTLEAIGQICERPDLSNGPRTVINAFQRIADRTSQRNRPYSPLDLIDDFLTGEIRFDGDRGKIASLVNELTSYDYIKRVPERVATLKLLAAFPRGCPREVAERYGLGEAFDLLLDELRGEVLLKLPEGVALIDLQKVGKPQDKLRIILKKYWMQITESEIIADRAQSLFARYGVEPLFPQFTSINHGWRSLTQGFQMTELGGLFQLYEGTFFGEYPLRRVAAQVCSALEQAVVVKEVDVHIVFMIRSKVLENVSVPRHLDNANTLILPVDIDQPFSRHLPRDIREIEDFLSPVVLTPGVLVSLLDYVDQQVPLVEGMSETESFRIANKTRKLQEFLLTMVFDDHLFLDQGIRVFSRGAQAVRDALFRILKRTFPDYQTLITSPAWRHILDSYEAALGQLDVSQRRGMESLRDEKSVIAAAFGQRSHAGFESYARQLDNLMHIVDWRGTDGEIAFSRHPAEQTLIEFIAVDGGLDRDSIDRQARALGYLPDEVDYLLRFLELRGYVDYDKKMRRYHPAQTLSSVELMSFAEAIRSEATLLEKVISSKTVNAVLAEIFDLQEMLKSDEEVECAGIQVRMLQLQRQTQQQRPLLVQHIYGHLHESRARLYEIYSQLEKALPESQTGLPLDKHVNGAQRSIQKVIQRMTRRLETLQTEVVNFTQQKVEVSLFDSEQLEAFVHASEGLSLRIETTLADAQRHVDRVELHEKWLYFVERIKRLFDSVEVARTFTDVTMLERRLGILSDEIQQELATRGTEDYQGIYDEYFEQVDALDRELDRLVLLAQQAFHSGSTAPRYSKSMELVVSSHSVSTIQSERIRSAGTLILERLFRSSEKSAEEFVEYLIELERGGLLEVWLLDIDND